MFQRLLTQLCLQENAIEREVYLAAMEVQTEKGTGGEVSNEQKPVIFVSCGQRSTDEKSLGNEMCEMVKELTPFDAYFAEKITSLHGLTSSIFPSINSACGFIFVMHKRGNVPPHDRGSVWIEQEIAIASFLQHTLDKKFHVAAYIQEGIKIEGVRQYIHLNPIQFTTNTDVLTHLKSILPSWGQV